MKVKIKKILDSIAHAGLISPRMITIMITNRCNLSCRHCLTDSHFSDHVHPIPAHAIKRLIEQSGRLGTEEICLTGGEPLMHPEWFDILSFACRQKNLKKICLQTNATLLTEVDIKSLCSINSKKLVVQVSVDGSTALTNDKVRGKGCFEKIIRALRFLTEAGLGPQVVVAFTEMQHNFMQLPELLCFLNELGIGSLVSGTLINAGRAGLTHQITPPTPTQYRELLNLYHSDPKFKTLYQKLGNIAVLEWFAGKSYPATACCQCIEKPYINAAGEIYPCLMLSIKKLAVKNVYYRPLDEVLLDGLPLWIELPDLHYRRSVEIEDCHTCPGKQHCAGGCMGRAYTATGDFMNVEDRCALRKEVYSWKSDQQQI